MNGWLMRSADGSTLTGLQIIADGELPNYESEVLRLTIGSAVRVTGELVESPGSGQRVEVKATAIVPYGFADPETYPLQKKRHSFEFLRTISHLRPRARTFGAVFRVREQQEVTRVYPITPRPRPGSRDRSPRRIPRRRRP